METSLHRELKRLYAGERRAPKSRIDGYRIDAVRGGRADRDPARLAGRHSRQDPQACLHGHACWWSSRSWPASCWSSESGRRAGHLARASPKRGKLLDVFDELVYFTRVFPHPRSDAGSGAGRSRRMAHPGPRPAAALAARRSRRRRSDALAERRRRRALRAAADLLELAAGGAAARSSTRATWPERLGIAATWRSASPTACARCKPSSRSASRATRCVYRLPKRRGRAAAATPRRERSRESGLPPSAVDRVPQLVPVHCVL